MDLIIAVIFTVISFYFNFKGEHHWINGNEKRYYVCSMCSVVSLLMAIIRLV